MTPRASGIALYHVRGYTYEVPSCLRCAKTIGVPWRRALFEGECTGCGEELTGEPVAGVES